ncbi:MAG: NAD-dependent epimerase/dehydratase family protein [Candidatus Dormibacteria bacterium]
MTARVVVVTGATGFVGRSTVRRLLDADWQVHAVARRPGPDVHPGLCWHRWDLLREPAAPLLAELGASHLMHLAWCAAPGKFWTDPANLVWARASLALFEAFAASGGQRILGAGSCAEYDWRAGFCSEEGTALLPTTLYGSAKLSTGSLLLAWGREVGIQTLWARLFHLYGPGEPAGKLVGSVVASLAADMSVDLTDGLQQRDFLHVDDVADALDHLLACAMTGAVNVASGRPVAVRDLVLELAGLAGRPELLRLGARRGGPQEPPLLVADVRRLRSSGWSPRIALTDGLRGLLEAGAGR